MVDGSLGSPNFQAAAALHIRPYTWPYPEISTAAMVSPSGPRLAGALGTSLLSLSMSVPGGYAAIETTWDTVREQAAKSDRPEPDRNNWRVLGIMHLSWGAGFLRGLLTGADTTVDTSRVTKR